MQNDLISRSEVLDFIKEELKQDRPDDFKIRNIERFIKDIPTSYSVEKVDQQILEYFKEQIDKKPDGWDVVDFSCDVRDIVRSGEKE